MQRKYVCLNHYNDLTELNSNLVENLPLFGDFRLWDIGLNIVTKTGSKVILNFNIAGTLIPKKNNCIAIIPIGFRPKNNIIIPVLFVDSYGYGTILQNGEIYVYPEINNPVYVGSTVEYYID